MTYRTARYNLTAAAFPLLSWHLGQTPAIRNPDDTNYIVTDAYSGYQANRDIGLPMPLYMHNVVPVTQGLLGAGFKKEIEGIPDKIDFDSAITLRDAKKRVHILVPAQGNCYILKDSVGRDWISNPISTKKLGGLVSQALVRDKTYFAFEGNGIYEYIYDNNNILPAAIKGLELSGIKGISTSQSLLLAFSDQTVYWSSALDPLDFIPSLSTGAGSAIPVGLRGTIVTVLPIENGFIIYTTKNAVVALWSGNLRAPWVFREIKNSAGIESAEHVSGNSDNNYGMHFAWTSAGLQQIDRDGANIFAPEIAEFLSGRILEDYIPDANLLGNDFSIAGTFASESQREDFRLAGINNLYQIKYFNPPKIKISVISHRYLAISYGILSLEYVIIYDISLRRWGKLKVSHTDIFEFIKGPGGLGEPFHNFGILDKSGKIETLDLSTNRVCRDSILLFGRINSRRNSVFELSTIWAQGSDIASMNTEVLSSMDTVNFIKLKDVVPQVRADRIDKLLCRVSAYSHILKFTGKIELSSLELSGRSV